MSKTMIDKMVDRFLGWKLPDDFSPDSYITFDREKAKQNPIFWPVGTNLLTANQAREMIQHMLAGAIPVEDFKDVTKFADERQAKIDALMLEYCPDEMTEAQKENWAKHQRPVSEEMQHEIDSALMGSNA